MAVGWFWGSVAALAYTYVGFPVLVALRGLLRPRPVGKAPVEPTVSIVIAAHNEAAVIGDKIRNLLALDYPRARREIVVVSDGSVDGTAAIVDAHADAGIRLLALDRVGKAAALTAGVAAATGDILVFSDANSMYAPDALRALVAPFADAAVGGVAGDQRYVSDVTRHGVAEGERRYWDLDRFLKRCESLAGNTISATGAIYAIRRELFDGVATGVTDDFYVSTGVIAGGFRLVFEPAAVAFEPVAPSGAREFDRKVRVISRGLRGVLVRRELLDPTRHGFYAVQLLTHKLLRRLMVVPLAIIAVASPGLWRRGRLYRAATAGQAAVYGLAAAGAVAGRRGGRVPAVLALPLYFCVTNFAALRALLNLLRGRRIERWEPRRDA